MYSDLDQLCDLYENDSIFDKFECCLSGDGTRVATGSYRYAFFKSLQNLPFFSPFFFPFRLSLRLEGIWLLKPFGMCNTNNVSMVPAISSAFLAVLQEAPRLQLWKPAKTPWGMCPNYNSNDQCMTNHGIKWFNNNDANISNKNNNATPPLRFVIISENDDVILWHIWRVWDKKKSLCQYCIWSTTLILLVGTTSVVFYVLFFYAY